LQIPLDPNIKQLIDVPYTISYVIRKRIQIDNLNEIPQDKRPPEMMIWDGTSEELEDWIDRVFDKKKKKDFDTAKILIFDSELE